jgi:hypothetical protein
MLREFETIMGIYQDQKKSPASPRMSDAELLVRLERLQRDLDGSAMTFRRAWAMPLRNSLTLTNQTTIDRIAYQVSQQLIYLTQRRCKPILCS